MIPKDKFDIEATEKLRHRSLEEIRAIVPQLLAWLQDMNWPVAAPISEFLVSIEKEITNEILEVFKTGDEMWKYWIISVFGRVTDSIAIKNEIVRIAHHPTDSELIDCLNELSLEVLASREWN